MDTQPISNCCPKCHAPLPVDAPQGLCPKCLLAAVATPTEASQPAGRPAPPPVEVIAAAFPQLEILEFVGQGGMGFVFKARQPKLDRLVALKILPQSLAADPTFAERFHREAKLLARLNHPGIVTVHDFGVVGQASRLSGETSERSASDTASGQATPNQTGRMPVPLYYLLMEFVDGVNLRQAMQAGRFTPDQALAIVPKICEALQFAHNEGILHRDIKPENILLDAKGRVKIADFGIAKLVGEGRAGSPLPAADLAPEPDRLKPELRTALTEAGKALGTPNYMAPEQLANAGDVDHRADIYSLGVVFYEMLTGELPRGQFAPPSQKSAADPRVDEVVLRALEKEKARRPASADEVRTQVETITGSAGVPPVSRSSGRESAPTESPANPESQSRLTSAATNQESRFSRTAIVGACWLAFVPLHFLLPLLFPSRNWFFEVIAFLQALLFWTAPVGVTLLGWVAVSQIRRSAGKLHGLWLAVFDGLVFPLLAVNFLIGGMVLAALLAVAGVFHHKGSPGTLGVLILSLPILIPLNRYIIRLVWRKVNAGGSKHQSAQNENRKKPEEPMWATYLWAAAWLIPSVLVWAVGCIYLQPRLDQAWRDTNPADLGQNSTFGWMVRAVSVLFRRGQYILLVVAVLVALMELLWPAWHRYRRAILKNLMITTGGVVMLGVTLAAVLSSGLMGYYYNSALRPNGAGNAVSSASQDSLSFGPVVERVVDDAIDLDTGKTGTTPLDGLMKSGFDRDLANIKGIEREGWDIIQDNPETIFGLDMKIVLLDSAIWGTLNPRQTVDRINAAHFQAFFPFSPVTNLPATYAFQTREGGMGLLQITGFTEDPSGVKLRYKLVQNGLSEEATSATSKEPSYGGRKLLGWLADIDTGWPKTEKGEHAREAMRKMGTNIIPFLLRDLNTSGPCTIRYDTQDFRSIDERSRQAVWAFDALGENAKSAIPDLVNILDKNPGYVPGALAGIGRDALPELLKALTNDVFWVRDNAAADLANAIYRGKITGREALAALPIAVSNLSYTNATNGMFEANTRKRAEDLIKAIRSDPALESLQIK